MTPKVVCNNWYWLNGLKVCSLNGTTGCRLTGEVACGMMEPEPKNYLMGWMCPRCGKVWSPFAIACDCPPRTITSNTTDITIQKEDENRSKNI